MKTLLMTLVFAPSLALAAAPRAVNLGDLHAKAMNGMTVKVAKGGSVTGRVLGNKPAVVEVVRGGDAWVNVKQPEVKTAAEVAFSAAVHGTKARKPSLVTRVRNYFEGKPAEATHGTSFEIRSLGKPVHGQMEYQPLTVRVTPEGAAPVTFQIEQ